MKFFIRSTVVTALIGTMAVVAPSAVSAGASVCLGIGEAHTTYLGLPIEVRSPPLDVEVRPPANGGFSLTLGLGGGVGGCVSTNGLSGLIANGQLTGWCGHSTGSGTLTDGSGAHDFVYSSAGSVLVIFGLDMATAGVANAVALPGAGGGANSCLDGNANIFQVTGVVVNV